MANQRRLFLMFVLWFSPWPGAHAERRRFFSHRGAQCADDCEPRGYPQTYQCTVHMKDSTEKLHYCSPMMNVDYKGNKCLDCCEKHGYGYYWCNTASQWGYCGYVIEDSKYYTSTYDALCYDSCDKQSGTTYYWCNSQKGWDYCSPRNNVDYKGKVCRSDHPCDKYGQSYYWCYLEDGSWDKCGRVEPRAMIYQTKKLKFCIDNCRYHESGEYYWCHTQDGWDYCSPLPDITYQDVPCRSDHKCGAYGQTYNWCYTTDNNDWDYCGVIIPGECMYSLPHRSKRHPNPPQVVCTREDNNNRRVTTFTAVIDNNAIAEPSNRLRREALDLINQWGSRDLGDRARSQIITSDHLRIDLQGLINRNNQRYYNLQIQENRPRSRGESTTLAQIIVPVDTSAEYMRLAFTESLRLRARISVEVTNLPNNNNQRCRRPR